MSPLTSDSLVTRYKDVTFAYTKMNLKTSLATISYQCVNWMVSNASLSKFSRIISRNLEQQHARNRIKYLSSLCLSFLTFYVNCCLGGKQPMTSGYVCSSESTFDMGYDSHFTDGKGCSDSPVQGSGLSLDYENIINYSCPWIMCEEIHQNRKVDCTHTLEMTSPVPLHCYDGTMTAMNEYIKWMNQHIDPETKKMAAVL